MADKTTRWAFTAYEQQWKYFEKMPPGIGEWGWQLEKCPSTGNLHYQGFIRTVGQHRFKGKRPADSLCRIFPGVHIEPAEDWVKLINYCKKKESKVEGHQPVHEVSTFPTMYSYSEELAERLPAWDQVRELWMTDNDNKMKEARRLKTEAGVLGLTLYKSPEEYAYDVILKTMVANDVRAGKPVEFISQNPLFITTWKNKIKDLIFRRDYPYEPPPSILDRQTDRYLISFN
jgi:hypothetical protein